MHRIGGHRIFERPPLGRRDGFGERPARCEGLVQVAHDGGGGSIADRPKRSQNIVGAGKEEGADETEREPGNASGRGANASTPVELLPLLRSTSCIQSEADGMYAMS